MLVVLQRAFIGRKSVMVVTQGFDVVMAARDIVLLTRAFAL